MVINVHVADNGQGGSPASIENDGIWRPVRFHSFSESTDEDDRRITESYRTLHSLLNKLSPMNFCTIVEKFNSFIFANPILLDRAVEFLIDKAITEPLFSRWYVEMLCSLSDGLPSDEIEDSIPYRIRAFFVDKLILAFNDLRTRESDEENRQLAVIGTVELQEQLNETEFRFRRKFIGVGRVLAESFNLGILTLNQLNQCIENLLSLPKETSLKCLYSVLTTVGKTFEFHLNDAEINEYFIKANNILENSILPTKSRYLLLNLIEYKENLWTSKSLSRNLMVVERILHVLSDLYRTKEDCISVTLSESDFLIEAEEAYIINNIFNKFTQCPRNLASAIKMFSELNAAKKTKIVRLLIMCVIKSDIYSEDCGKLFACLIQSGNVIIPDIILGVVTVIHGYRKQLIFADQQIWTRLKEIFQPLFAGDLCSLNDLEDDSIVQKARKMEEQKEEQSKTKPKSELPKSKLSWRRGLPVVQKDKGVLKKQSDTNPLNGSEKTKVILKKQSDTNPLNGPEDTESKKSADES